MQDTLTEAKTTEAKVTEWLSKMGWTLKSPEEMKEYKRPLSNPIVDEILIEYTVKLNKIDEKDAKLAVEILKQHLRGNVPIESNELFLKALVDGVNLKINNEDKTIYFIDYTDIFINNSLIVTNQYYIQGNKPIRPDIVLLVNGIPLVAIEAKQTAKKNANYLQGIRQLSLYESKAPSMYICNAFAVACNGRLCKYGIPGASSAYFNEWKDTTLDPTQDNPIIDNNQGLCTVGLNSDDGYYHFDVDHYPDGSVMEKMKLGIIGLLQPARVLDILKHFLVFERDKGKIIKKVARYQQLRAANKIVRRVVEEDINQGIVWHTQGSGKSLTMVYTAIKLTDEPELHDPTIYIIVDRRDLRKQIGGTFDDCEFPNVRSIRSIGDLKDVIKNKPSGVYITTVQKFQELNDRVDDRTNVIVLIDEAHRTEYGDYQMELRHALPNAKRFAFTGTPIPKTHQEFGNITEEKKELYLDKYSIQDAIEDGATKPVHYTFGPMEYFLDKEKLAEGYAEITAELDDDEKRLVEHRVQPWKQFLKKQERIETIAKDIAEDFKEQVEPEGFKAQVVACDKEACVLYYKELLKYFTADEIVIIFSQGQYEESERYEFFKDYYLDDRTQDKLIEKFKTPGTDLKLLIVCNMLLTGFDAPVEQTMYLDSPLRDHNLLQAVARTNRPYVNKETKIEKDFGRIVDYIGIFQNYKDALNYNPEDIGEFYDIDTIAKKFPDVIKAAMEPFKDIKLEDSYECQMAIIRALSQTDQTKFEMNFHNTVQFWETISPNPIIYEYKMQYLWLVTIYELYLNEFKRIDFDAEVYAEKTRKLIQESIMLLNFKGHMPEIKIDKDYLENLKRIKLTPSDKAEKIIRDIETVIRKNELGSSVYIEFQHRLDELVKRKNEETITLEELINQLSLLYTEVEDVSSLPEKLGFEDKGTFEFYMTLKKKCPDSDETILQNLAKELVAMIKAKIYIGWQDSKSEIKNIKDEMMIITGGPEYEKLNLYSDDELLIQLQNKALEYYSLT